MSPLPESCVARDLMESKNSFLGPDGDAPLIESVSKDLVKWEEGVSNLVIKRLYPPMSSLKCDGILRIPKIMRTGFFREITMVDINNILPNNCNFIEHYPKSADRVLNRYGVQMNFGGHLLTVTNTETDAQVQMVTRRTGELDHQEQYILAAVACLPSESWDNMKKQGVVVLEDVLYGDPHMQVAGISEGGILKPVSWMDYASNKYFETKSPTAVYLTH